LTVSRTAGGDLMARLKMVVSTGDDWPYMAFMRADCKYPSAAALQCKKLRVFLFHIVVVFMRKQPTPVAYIASALR
jgi:hypothetical protein